jgi:hypothetical protein
MCGVQFDTPRMNLLKMFLPLILGLKQIASRLPPNKDLFSLSPCKRKYLEPKIIRLIWKENKLPKRVGLQHWSNLYAISALMQQITNLQTGL